MTFKEFQVELALEANKRGIDPEPILEKYKNRFNLGVEAGIDEEEIVSRFGKIEDILGPTQEKIEHASSTNKKELFISLDAGTSTINFVDGDKITYSLDERAKNLYLVKDEDNRFEISFKTKNLFSHKTTNVIINIGKDLDLTNVTLNLVSSDLKVNGKLVCEELKLDTMSADISFDGIEVKKNAKFSLISGDMNISSLKANNVSLSTVSGDVKINTTIVEKLSISTVSGDVTVDGLVSTIKSSSVSGDVIYNGTFVNESVAKKLKNVFGRKNG